MLRRNEFPTRDNCDPSDPEEAFLWMFAALPGTRGGPLLMPVEYLRLVSKRLWDLGARPVEQPTLEWVPPQASEPNWMTSPGRWVEPGSQGDSDHEARAAVAKMSPQQRHELQKALEADVPPETTVGSVVRSMTLVQRQTVLRVLRGGV